MERIRAEGNSVGQAGAGTCHSCCCGGQYPAVTPQPSAQWGHGGQCGDWSREQASLSVSVRAQIRLICEQRPPCAGPQQPLCGQGQMSTLLMQPQCFGKSFHTQGVEASVRSFYRGGRPGGAGQLCSSSGGSLPLFPGVSLLWVTAGLFCLVPAMGALGCGRLQAQLVGQIICMNCSS